jgi:hypothetical protein
VPVEFAILGSLEVRAGGRVVDLGGAVQRRMLAALLLRPNRVVTIERLVEVGWDGAPPSTAERQVRTRVAALRSILTRHDDLAGLVAAHPLRERLVGRLMTVLAAAGRQDEALAAYDRLADRLADRLGIDPSPELRALRVRLLGGPPEPDVPTPQQLPADVTGFTGRVEDLDRLDRMLSDAQADHAVVISAIAGTAGVGKTALAVHWGHRVRSKFPDGQLYTNLRGFSQMAAVPAVDALGGFLRALGVSPEKVPTDLDAAATAYRGRGGAPRGLVVVD